MVSNSRLEELKKQVRDTSNQKYQVKQQKSELMSEVAHQNEVSQVNEKEMARFVQSVFGRTELANEKDRALLQNKIDKFSYQQQVMNENIIALNDNLTDTTSLEVLYATKRKELELNYANQEESLKRQIQAITERLEARKSDVDELDREIQEKQFKLTQIVADTKKATFLNSFKKTFIDKWFVFALVGFIGLIIGGFAGWSVFSFFGSIINGIKDTIGSLFV